jgi:outer membrane protein assembly factor BamB
VAVGLLATGIGGSTASAAPAIAAGDGWPVIGGFDARGDFGGIDAQGNVYLRGFTGFSSVTPGGRLRWAVDYQRTSGLPFVSGDRVYAWDGVSLDAFGTDGSLEWRRRFEGARKGVAPGPAGGALVYGPGGLNGPVIIDSIGPDEVRRWSTPVAGTFLRSAPVTAPDGTVLTIGENGELIALDGATGRVRWRTSVAGASFRAPAVGPDGEVVVAGNSYSSETKTTSAIVRAVSPDGSARWSYPVGGNVLDPVAVDGDGVTFVAIEGGSLIAIGPDGARRWETSIAPRLTSGPVVGTDGRVSVRSASGAGGAPPGTVTTVDPATGAIVATSLGLVPGRLSAVLPTSGGRLFVQSGGSLWLLDPAARRTRVARYRARLMDATARLAARPRRCADRSSRQVCLFSGDVGTTLELRAPRAGNATLQIRRVADGRLLAMKGAIQVPAGISRVRLGSYRCLDRTSTACSAPGRYRVTVRFTGGHRPVTVGAGVLRVLPSAGRALF